MQKPLPLQGYETCWAGSANLQFPGDDLHTLFVLVACYPPTPLSLSPPPLKRGWLFVPEPITFSAVYISRLRSVQLR